jgi:hypothetical protein
MHAKPDLRVKFVHGDLGRYPLYETIAAIS